MTVNHDIFRQIEYIQQSLSQNKKPIGFFIGAGCPLSVRVNIRDENGTRVSDPLIPDVSGLTMLISDQLSSGTEKPSDYDLLIKLIKEDGTIDPNVEIILTQIRSLISVVGKGTVRGFNEKQLTELDEKICKIISIEVDKELPDLSTPYHNLAIWTRTINRDVPVHIFTTNYDLLIEQSFEESTAPYFDGFIGTRKAFFDLGAVENEKLLHPRWSRLWKIHGSINWKLDKNTNVIRSDKLDKNQSYLIYPSHLKYLQSRKMPYLAMLDRLKEFLITPASVLFITGYSFSDEHINDVISSSLSSNPTSMVFAFLYGQLSDEKYIDARECALNNPNLTLLAQDKGFVGRIEGKWKFSEDKLDNIPKGTIKITKNDVDESNNYELMLGDFFHFGNLLKGLTSSGIHDEASDVE